MRKFQTLGGAIMLALTGALIIAPADARTRHPSTPQERSQTRDLNLQQLAQAQAPANQQAMNAAQPSQQQQAPAQAQPNAPTQQGQAQQVPNAPAPNASSSGAQAPAPSDQSAPQAQQPSPSGSQ